MIEAVKDISTQALSRFDVIIDVRSPAEFAEDHIPGAINLPVLDDAQRAEVGTIYKQESRLKARRVGAAHVARNVARHLETELAEKPSSFYPMIYCWRGGMRSNAMATILTQVGWRCAVLSGGYKTWRRAVIAELRNSDAPLPIILLDGQTGVAKSDILRSARNAGVQILDLEELACHRGSVFGGFQDTPQPDQKCFETMLFDALRRLDLSKPILVEAESNRIGRCEIPARLWKAMLAAPHIVIEASPKIRATYLLSAYTDIVADDRVAKAAIDKLGRFHSKETIGEWRGMADAGEWRSFAEALMRAHYDPAYERSRKHGRQGQPIAQFRLEALDNATFEQVAQTIASVLSSPKHKELIHGRS